MARQRTPEWLEVRRQGISSTDIPAILGISPWASEGDIAREKMGIVVERERTPEAERKMRIGLALEETIKEEEEVEHGHVLRHVDDLIVHPTLPWALTSLDYERIDERCIVEAKTSMSRDWDDGLPQYVEAQVRWQMGVMDVPVADVAALVGDELLTFELEHDPALFDGMVAIAEDFRRRLAAGGPFAHNSDSVRRAYPADDGSEAVADDEVAAAVARLQEIRSEIDRLERNEDALKVAIQTRMGEHAVLHTPGFDVIWRRSKDGTTTDWKAVVDELIGSLAGTERDALLGRHTTVRPGMRPFRVVAAKEGR